MDSTTLRPRCAPGIIAAIVLALIPCYWIGIGGSLVAAAAGVVATLVACNVLGKSAEKALHAQEGSAQLVGVLDSSQLGGDYEVLDNTGEALARAERASKFVVAVALVATLVGAGGVQLATGGRGIHFYLGSWSFPDVFGAIGSKMRQEAEVDGSQDHAPAQSSSSASSSSSSPSSSSSSSSSSSEGVPQPSDADDASMEPETNASEDSAQPQEEPTPAEEQVPDQTTPTNDAATQEQPVAGGEADE